MAAGQNVPEPGGYDFEFTSKVPDDLECPVCHFAMKDPVQIVRCGHRFCNLCLEGCFSRHSLECPVDRQPFSPDKIFSDIACHRRILNLTAKCSYAGCPWKGELRAVESHQSECLLKVIECPNEGCKEKLTRLYMNNHKMSKCTWRKMKCEYCVESFIMRNKQVCLSDSHNFNEMDEIWRYSSYKELYLILSATS
ncbi:TNF receptor-associated factor 4-like [Stylophora pistillata]|uniref:TNF receptor-associated factor 4-like n=1 Tax=Stylophora pistillata TaxID=50429 RepID=UPI000C03AF18|nr:TNF receptor-associated factor 4-like [Stylophora pistillata]